ncbi:MAG: acyl carrier protein [Acidobacteriaceae bacterium]|nr:acyl carrier protein [Acidobacteriaceae bacterium]
MNCQMLDPRLVALISDVFGIPEEDVTPESSSESIPDWDSVGHLRLVMRLEESFGLRFPTADIPKLVSAAQIQERLNRLGIAAK